MKILKYIFSIALVVAAVAATVFFSPGGRMTADASCALPPVSAQTVSSSGSLDASANWSGYVAATGTFTGVTGTWTIANPMVATSTVTARTAADATWVGIGGVTSRNLIQAGTQAIVDAQGNVTYEAWYETLPQSETVVPLTVNAGDSITATLSQTAPGEWEITLHDNTQGTHYVSSVSYNSTLSTAEWIEEVPSAGRRNAISLDNFGTVAFTGAYATVNGTQESMAAAGAEAVTMVNNANQTLASPSSVGADGASFTVARSSASSSVSRPTVTYQYGNGTGSSFGQSGFGNGTGFGDGTGITVSIPMPMPWFRTTGSGGFGRTVRSVWQSTGRTGVGTVSESYRIVW